MSRLGLQRPVSTKLRWRVEASASSASSIWLRRRWSRQRRRRGPTPRGGAGGERGAAVTPGTVRPGRDTAMTSQVTAVARLVVAQRVDQLVLAHVRAAFDAELLRAVLEVVDRPVLVAARLAALLGHVLATRLGVGDAGGLLLAGAVLAQLLVELVVLDARSVVLGHVLRVPRRPGAKRPPVRPPRRARRRPRAD